MTRFKKELIIVGILLGVLIFAGGAWSMNKEKYRPDIVGELEASTESGQITYGDLVLTVSQDSKHKLTGRIGKGGGSINIKTSTGTINLKILGNSFN